MRHTHTIVRPLRRAELSASYLDDIPFTTDGFVKTFTETYLWNPMAAKLLLVRSSGPKNCGFQEPRGRASRWTR